MKDIYHDLRPHSPFTQPWPLSKLLQEWLDHHPDPSWPWPTSGPFSNLQVSLALFGQSVEARESISLSRYWVNSCTPLRSREGKCPNLDRTEACKIWCRQLVYEPEYPWMQPETIIVLLACRVPVSDETRKFSSYTILFMRNLTLPQTKSHTAAIDEDISGVVIKDGGNVVLGKVVGAVAH